MLRDKKARCVLPCSDEKVPFCDFMGYEFVKKEGDYSYYRVPAGQICRFNINFESWKEGTFDKEKFLNNLKQ